MVELIMQWAAVKIYLSLITVPPHLKSTVPSENQSILKLTTINNEEMRLHIF